MPCVVPYFYTYFKIKKRRREEKQTSGGGGGDGWVTDGPPFQSLTSCFFLSLFPRTRSFAWLARSSSLPTYYHQLSLTHLHTHTQSLFSTVLALLLLLLMQRNTAIRKIPSPRRRRRHPSVEQNKKTRKCIISDANKKMARNYLFLHSHQLKKRKKVGFKYESRVNVDYSRESRES